jgi:hypothetical protein
MASLKYGSLHPAPEDYVAWDYMRSVPVGTLRPGVQAGAAAHYRAPAYILD